MLYFLWCLIVTGFPDPEPTVKKCCHDYQWKTKVFTGSLGGEIETDYQVGCCKTCGWQIERLIEEDDSEEGDE